MPCISCEVKKCIYNTDGGCKLNEIKVGTHSARMTDETLCESFSPYETVTTNTCGCSDEACDNSEIECSAENCKYNDDGYCDACKIEIRTCHTGNCGETECETFDAE